MSTPHPAIPFIATDLTVIQTPSPADPATDLLADGKVYRPLNPDYYLWLRHKMELAKTAYSHGRLSEPAFDALRTRFNAVHDQALAIFGMESLSDTSRHFDPKTYRYPGLDIETADNPAATPAEIPNNAPEPIPPANDRSSFEGHDAPSIPSPAAGEDTWTDHEYPEDDTAFPRLHTVRQSALDKVRAIENEALAAGWSHAELYQNRGRFAFPCGNDYGLACFVHPDQQLGKVTAKAIEVIQRAGHSLHFYRPGELP